MTGGSLEEAEFRAAFEAARRQAQEGAPDERGLRPRGIVIPAGGARMFTCAWVSVRMLREVLKTRLPIQVWHLGPQEMSPAMAGLLAEQDVEIVDAEALAGAHHPGALGGFELKSFALLNCPFREVILLDADNLPLIDPEELLDLAAFRETGAMFWPDIVSLLPASRIWELCGVPYRAMPSFESGQAVIDRVRCHAGLSLSWFMNRHSKLVYRHIYGDKDTFLLAWLALGQPFYLIPHRVQRLLGCLCQHHPDGRRMFQHRNKQKWLLHGFNPRIEGFFEEERCFGFLDELRSRWTGRILTPPPADDGMRDIEGQLIEARRFVLELVSVGTETIELHPHNLVKRAMGKPASWWLAREKGLITLLFGEDDVISRRFVQYGQHYWRSPARDTNDHDVILYHEPGLAPLGQTGHNSDSIYRSFGSWPANYEPNDDRNGG